MHGEELLASIAKLQAAPAGGSGSLAVQDEGAALGAFTAINFSGAGVTATNAGGGVALVTIPGGGGGSATVASATVTVPYGSFDYLATITDASVTGASKVIIAPGMYAQTDTNSPNDANANVESVAAGSFTLRISGNGRESIGGPFKFLYILG